MKAYTNVIFVNDNFKNIKTIVENLKLTKVNGILADLGLSTYHYKQSQKGFSFEKDDKLDMRLNKNQNVTAYDIINHYTEKEITEIIWAYGEDTWAKRIGKFIAENRKKKNIDITS